LAENVVTNTRVSIYIRIMICGHVMCLMRTCALVSTCTYTCGVPRVDRVSIISNHVYQLFLFLSFSIKKIFCYFTIHICIQMQATNIFARKSRMFWLVIEHYILILIVWFHLYLGTELYIIL